MNILTARARVVVVGSGRMGHIRSSLLYANPRFELLGHVDVNHASAKALAATYQTRAYDSLEQAIADTQLDAIVVSSPTFTHAEVIRRSAQHGISVFTEKPVDETALKIESLFRISKEAGIHLCCGFQRRFDASYTAAIEALPRIGTPVAAHLTFYDHPCSPLDFLLEGGNIVMDLAPHDIDYIRHALQDEVVSVYASGSSSTDQLKAANVYDNATLMMKFSKGTVATLFMSRSSPYGYDQRCEIFGDQGFTSIGNESEHSTLVGDQFGIHASKLQHSFPQRFHQAFEKEMNAFCDTIMLGTKWPVTGHDCVQVQRVADAAKLSMELDQMVQVAHDDLDLDSDSVATSL